MTEDANGLVTAVLRPGERLLWAGRPDPGVVFVPADAVAIPMSLAVTSFLGFWLYAVATGGAPLFFLLWGAMLGVLSLYMLIGRFIVRRIRLQRTRYALTDRRALVLNTTGLDRTEASVSMWGPVTVRRSKDGEHGSVEFVPAGGGRYPAWFVEAGLYPWARSDAVAFRDVADFEPLATAVETVQRVHDEHRRAASEDDLD